jgi:hypothetical protein
MTYSSHPRRTSTDSSGLGTARKLLSSPPAVDKNGGTAFTTEGPFAGRAGSALLAAVPCSRCGSLPDASTDASVRPASVLLNTNGRRSHRPCQASPVDRRRGR